MFGRNEMSPANPPPNDRRQRIVQFWMALELDGDPGATTREVLDGLRDRVTECLAIEDIATAESLTAKALLYIEGLEQL